MTEQTPEELRDSVGDERLTEKDTSYSPASEREMEAREAEPSSSAATDDPDIDDSSVDLLPGTGGQDDQGDVDVDPDEIRMPRDAGAH